MGTPVVSTVYVNSDNIINEKSLGIIAKDFDEIPCRINELLNKTDDEYQQLAEKCRRYVVENHNAEKLAKEFINNIEE